MFKTLLSFFIIFIFVGCLEPKSDEFSQMRNDMQSSRQRMFEQSAYNLQHRKEFTSNHNKSKYLHKQEEEEQRKREELERKKWLDVGISDDEAQDWKALNLSPKHSLRWKKTGLSYNAIAVLLKEDVLPSEAIEFMTKYFVKKPKVFYIFAEPLYDFEESCQKILKEDIKKIVLINKKCSEYNQNIAFNEISGHLADKYKNNDLSLEYISKLRQSDNQKEYIQKLITKEYKKSLVQDDIKVFTLLFPIVEYSPSKEEMFYVSKNHLKLKNTKRYKSHKFYEFWVNKEINEEKARIAVIKKQKSLKRAKVKRLRAEAHRLDILAYNKSVAAECGELVKSEPSTGEKVHLEGKILNTVGKKKSNIYAYIILNTNDGKKYLVREPNSKRKVDKTKDISWIVTTVGRVVSVSIDEDGTASYNHYNNESKEYYTMLKYNNECKYFTSGF